MDKKVKYGIIAGVSLIAIGFGSYYLRNAWKKRRLNRPCKGRRCVKSLVGKSVRPSGVEVNVRESAEVKTGWSDNLITSFKGDYLGKIKQEVMGADGYVWYLVTFPSPLKGKTQGYVREDVIEIIK